jgi:hypothetical protein
VHRLIWVLAVLVVLSTGCGGGTAIATRQSCSGTFASGTCQGSIGRLSGVHAIGVEGDPDGFADAAQVRAEITVERGRLNVSVESPDGDVESVEVSPGSAAVLEGEVEITFEEFDISFEALDGEASGIAYTVEYQVL